MYISKPKSDIRAWFLIISFAISPCLIFSQNKTEISSGVGLPDLINVKLKYGREFQIYGGAGLLTSNTIWSFTAGFDCHFPLKSKKDKTRKLYLSNGIANISSIIPSSGKSEDLFVLCSRIGISVCNSPKNDRSGFDFDLGIMFEPGQKYETINRPPANGRPTTVRVERAPIIFPAASISYFFKL